MHDPDEHVKTVYANFGSARYYAQVLEHGLPMRLYCLASYRASTVSSETEWPEYVDMFFASKIRQTLVG